MHIFPERSWSKASEFLSIIKPIFKSDHPITMNRRKLKIHRQGLAGGFLIFA
jgi:hypothetical protein